MAYARFADQKTPGDHTCGEAASALQKSLRRGLERDALYWASELDKAGYGPYVWKRLRIIASEDVGLAAPELPGTLDALHRSWNDYRKDPGLNHLLFMVHAICLIARAPKSRMVDNALNVMWVGPRPEMEVPDYALDVHTRRGRAMKRGNKHFYEAAGLLENPGDVHDPYAEEAKAIDLGLDKPEQTSLEEE